MSAIVDSFLESVERVEKENDCRVVAVEFVDDRIVFAVEPN